MKTLLENNPNGYDTRLEASDWRYGASIVGLILYFNYLKMIHGRDYYEEEEEAILYSSTDITEERYLEFAEHFFIDDMHHKKAEEYLGKDEFSSEDIKLINEKLIANTSMKNVFAKEKFDGENKDKIISIIQKNRYLFIRETFKNKKNLYENYANKNLFLNRKEQPHCRLKGYIVDEGRKSKSVSYQFDAAAFVSEDCLEFDFIPFAFTNTREALFINNNFTVKQLRETYHELKRIMKNELEAEKGNAKSAFFGAIIKSSDFIDYDVEVIVKDREKEFYETLYIRKDAIRILQDIKDKKAFSFNYKKGENYYINIQNEVVEHIFNHILLDDLIEMLLKDKEWNGRYLIQQLIDVNVRMKGEKDMTKDMKSAFACAKEVVKTFLERKQENKIDTYRQKLISSIVFHDYDRACDILLQLSNYSEVSFGFAYPLFEDFEGNKELAYTFINALEITKKNNKEDK